MEYHEGSGHQQHEGCKKRKRQNWTDLETSVLLECKDKHGEKESRFCKGISAVTDWAAIGWEIADRLGSKSIAKSGEQCRYRWETLIKAYKKVRKHCEDEGKQFSELTRTEKVELKLATTLKDEWYEVIEQSYGTGFRCANRKSGQVDNALPTLVDTPGSASSCNHRFDIPATQHESRSLDPGQPLIEAEMAPLHLLHGCNTHEIGDLNHVGSHTPTQFESGSTLVRNSETLEKEDGATRVTPECTTERYALIPRAPESPIPSERLNQKSRLEIVTIPGFNSMQRDLKSTLLNLIFKASWGNDFVILSWSNVNEMEGLCRWLAYVQGVRLLEVRVQVLELVRRDLVTISNNSYGSRISLHLSTLRKFKQYLEKVVRTHFLRLDDDNESSLDSSLLTDRLKVVALVGCKVLKKVDLGNMPKLRSLVIMKCRELIEVCGWENLRELGWLEITDCFPYPDCPKIECLPSLKEFHLGTVKWTDETWFKLDFSQCVQLRGLDIWDVREMEIRDLSTLKCLEELSFNYCLDLKSMVGLSGLHSLSLLKLQNCKALKRLPDLGRVTSLVELDLSGSGVEEIPGIENLLSLTRLLLRGCEHLKRLPYLGYLTALAHLDISVTGVDEIPGVREMVNLKTLDCCRSKLMWLPNLGHLPCLEWVNVEDTPFLQVPSSIYFGRGKVRFNEDLDVEDDIRNTE